MSCIYELVPGDVRSTSLPENTFDKLIIINSFHEFTYQTEMPADVKKKLKTGGNLYVDEALSKRPRGKLHGFCDLTMLNNEEMIAFFAENGFEYINRLEFNYCQKIPVRKVFTFRIARCLKAINLSGFNLSFLIFITSSINKYEKVIFCFAP